MNTTKARVERLVTKLREDNYRITPQRLALIDILVSDSGHPSVSQIYEQLRTQFPTTSLATVYKTLNVLKRLGEVKEIILSDDDTRYDLTNLDPHPHLICVQCHSITDAELCDLEAITRDISAQYNFKVLDQRLDFFGICADCQRGT